MRIARLVVVLVAVVVMGCASDAAGPDPTAITKCREWSATFCDRVVACDPSAPRETCLSALASSLDCGRAARVSSSFDRCMVEVRSFDCAAFDSGAMLPASCQGVIETAP
jgi:hypothetical protein